MFLTGKQKGIKMLFFDRLKKLNNPKLKKILLAISIAAFLPVLGGLYILFSKGSSFSQIVVYFTGCFIDCILLPSILVIFLLIPKKYFPVKDFAIGVIALSFFFWAIYMILSFYIPYYFYEQAMQLK